MTVEDNKELVFSWFEAAFAGDTDKWLGLMHDDFRYWVPGNMSFSGWTDRDGLLRASEMLSLYIFQTFDIPEVRGEPKPRESPVEEVTRTFGGVIPDVEVGAAK